MKQKTKAELNKMLKPELVQYAFDKLQGKIRKNQPKATMVKQILTLQKERAKLAKPEPTKTKTATKPEPEETVEEETTVDEVEEETVSEEVETSVKEDDGHYPRAVDDPALDLHRPVAGGIMMGGMPEDGRSVTRKTGQTHAIDAGVVEEG